MFRALTAEQSLSVEARAVSEQGLMLAALMRAAGTAVANELAQRVPDGEVVVLAGPGNNGGDGWVAARVLAARGRAVRVLSLVEPDMLPDPAAGAAREAIAAGVTWRALSEPPGAADFAAAAALVDALLGVGSSGRLREPLDAWVEAANAIDAYVLAVDCPTGVDADTGAVSGAAIDAECTVTFSAPKRGLVLYPGAGHAGDIVVAGIGIDPAFADIADAPEVWSAEDYARLLPRASTTAHKNERGRVFVVAGSAAYAGAAILCARGAMRAGAGFVTLAVPESLVPIAQTHLLAATVVGLPQGRTHALSSSALEKTLQHARDYDAVVLGPGLTQVDGAVVTARGLVARLDRPLVIDADGLNALVDAGGILAGRTAATVLTPHPGELGRLLGVPGSEVQADRLSASSRLAGPNRAVVLKGAGTVVSGAGRQVVNTSGTSALATAGTGDVLAGIIGTFLAQGLSPLDAGALGAYLHGRAGEAAAASLTPVCVTAEDLPGFLPSAVAELLASGPLTNRIRLIRGGSPS